MPDLPKLAITEVCPDPDCNAKIGDPHVEGCAVAICITTGVQRLIHETTDAAPASDVPHSVDMHTCGKDVWVGYPHGALTAAAHGLFARLALPADPAFGGIPCTPDHPDARPDISALVRMSRWNPTAQVFELTSAVAA